MRIDIISAVPQLLEDFYTKSIIGNAVDQELVTVHIHNLRDYTDDPHRKIDDYPYGGGGGMVLSPQPIFDCIEKLKGQRKYDEIIFTTPAGKPFNQEQANKLSLEENIIILCGHYKGVDQRVRDVLVTKEISLGDFVLTGGEIPAMAITDAIVRLIPGVLGDAESALSDSFQDDLLEGPVYTRPHEYRGIQVPDILTSGNHKQIEEWKFKQAQQQTRDVRPDLYKQFLDKEK